MCSAVDQRVGCHLSAKKDGRRHTHTHKHAHNNNHNHKSKDLLLYIVKLYQPEIAKMNPHLENVMSFQNRNRADKRERATIKKRKHNEFSLFLCVFSVVLYFAKVKPKNFILECTCFL